MKKKDGKPAHSKLTAEQVAEIRSRRAGLAWNTKSKDKRATIKWLASEFGVCPNNISLIVNNKTWKTP